MEIRKILKRTCEVSDLTVKEQIQYLFAGCFDKGKERYSTQTYKTQADIAVAIADATDHKCTPNQPAISKQLKQLCDILWELNDDVFVIHESSDGYVRMNANDAFKFSCSQLLGNFDPEDVFYNDITKPTEYAFKLHYLEYEKIVVKLLESIFKGCIFNIEILGKEALNSSVTKPGKKKEELIIIVKLCPLSDTFSKTSRDFMSFLTEYCKKSSNR